MLDTLLLRVQRTLLIAWREAAVAIRRPLLIFCTLVAPILVMTFFPSLMREGLPTRLPAGLVDDDYTPTTRNIVRILSAMQVTHLKTRYATFHEAREAMQRGEIYAFFHIPKGTTERALASRQPQIAFYTNDAYFVAGALLMKDLKLISELTGLAITRATLNAKGVPANMVMGILQPIVIETHPVGNPGLNYNVLLTNGIVPGIFILLIMICTVYTLGLEWKLGTQHYLLNLAGGSVPVALCGKLLPQTVVFAAMFAVMDVYFYRILGFPCRCGLAPMMALGAATVLVSQAFSIAIYGVFPGMMRFGMSVAALIGVLSIPLAGFSYPTTAMHPVFQTLQYCFPLRDYFLLYANQALNGYPLMMAWRPLVAYGVLLALPFVTLPIYAWTFDNKRYVP